MADKAAFTSNGGQYTNCITVNTAINGIANSTGGVLANGPGRLCRVAWTNHANTITLYDNSVGPGGNILWNTPINTAQNSLDLQFSFQNSIWISGNGPQCQITFALAGPGGT